MLYFGSFDVFKGIDVNKTRDFNKSDANKSVMFVTIGIFQIKGLSFSQMSGKGVMMY